MARHHNGSPRPDSGASSHVLSNSLGWSEPEISRRASRLLRAVCTAGGRAMPVDLASEWAADIGSDVLSASSTRAASTPTEALSAYILTRGGAAALAAPPLRYAAPNAEPVHLPLPVWQRIKRLASHLGRSPTEVLEWSAVIAAVVLSDPVAARAGSAKDALSAFVLHSYARAHSVSD